MASILDRGPHCVIVTPMVTVQDTLGTRLVPGTPVTMHNVSVQAQLSRRTDATDEIEMIGTQAEVAYRVMGRGVWPGGHMSQIQVVVGPRPGLYDQRGEPAQNSMSKRTQHFDVVMTARGVEVK